jgi:hypothetical protein
VQSGKITLAKTSQLTEIEEEPPIDLPEPDFDLPLMIDTKEP